MTNTKIKKRFVAGAKCPKCSAKDSILLYKENGIETLEVTGSIANITKSAQKIPILLVEQNAKLALEAAHRGYVMDSGSITLTGEARQLLDDPKVREAYLGEAA